MSNSTSNMLTVYNMDITCPVCHDRVDPVNFMEHVLQEHTYFFVVWSSLNMPWMYNPENDEDDVDTLSYEYLSALCEAIGNYRVGIDDIDKVSTVEESANVTCPICLEDDVTKARKITKCGHTFCCSCIEKWLSSHRKCPVCIQEVTDD